MRFRIRYLQHNLELPPGQFVIGRSTECQLSLDDPLVSRRHARLIVTEAGVFIEDLGSRNGVLIGGARIEGRRKIEHGTRLLVGSQELTILDDALGSSAPSHHAYRDSNLPGQATTSVSLPAPTPSSLEPLAFSAPPFSDETSRRIDALRVLSGVANKALALGRAEEAERIVQARLQQVLDLARDAPWTINNDLVDQAARLAAKLAGASGKGEWVDYVIELYKLQARLMPAPLVDELFTVLRKVSVVNLRSMRDYLEGIQERTGSLGAADRFLLQRIEGLERLAASK
jgi:hypothetical protein